MTKLREDRLSPNKLLFDPNNYRFQDADGFVYAASERFHETGVQERAYQRLRRDETLVELKRSIMRNGYVPVERIVVRPYSTPDGDEYLVIEGNRRLAAVQWMLEDYEAGVKLPADVLASVQELPVVIAEEKTPDEVFRASLMGIRHVAGIKQWGGYQRAKLIASMRDELELEPGEVAERLGLSTQEVNRRYRAYKALQQMLGDEEYEGSSGPSMYPLFHEAVSLPIVREWLKWDENECEFKSEEKRNLFYELLTPSAGDDGDRPAKIKTYSQVRELRSILSKSEATKVLLDPHRSFQEAVNIARRDELSRLWAADIVSAIGSLETMGVQELKNMSTEDVELLNKLTSIVEERLADFKSLGSQKE